MKKLIIIWLSLLTILVLWVVFLPQLIDVWQFKHNKFGGWTSCPYPNDGRIVGANNEVDFDWIDLRWQEFTVVKDKDACK